MKCQANIKKLLKPPKFTAKTKKQNTILQKTKGGVKDEPALHLSLVSGKYLLAEEPYGVDLATLRLLKLTSK